VASQTEAQPVRKILIVGGGTAGWITAGVLASRFPQRGEAGISVTLIESRQQPPIGVGEGTWPTIRTTLKQIGVTETDFLRACDASFKQGSQFVKWLDGGAADAYYHPFTLPVGYEERNLAPYWLEDPRGDSFAASMCFQTNVCSRALAPKQITTPEFTGLANYAYHLDAGKFGPFLRTHCIDKLGVVHRYDEIVRVESKESGDISQVVTKSGEALAADLYVDCSGFSSLLIGKHLGVPFLPKKDVLFIDKAWAVQIPYPTDDAPFIIPRGDAAKLFQLDLSILRSTVRPGKLLKNDGTLEACCVIQSVRVAAPGIARQNATFDGGTLFLTVRSFLSANAIRATNSLDGIDHCSSNNSTVCALQSISVPVLFGAMGWLLQDQFVRIASATLGDEARASFRAYEPSADFLGGSMPRNFITICRSFQASPFWRGSRSRNAG